MSYAIIVWHHFKSCRADLRSHRVGSLTISRRSGGQVVIGNSKREWRLR